jgi:hypothetical protein
MGVPRETGRLRIECISVQRLIQEAHGIYSDGTLKPSQMELSGGPDWLQDTYGTGAKAAGVAVFVVWQGR